MMATKMLLFGYERPHPSFVQELQDSFEVLRGIKVYFFRKNKTKIEYNISADRL